MSQKVSRFKVGLFMLLGMLMALGAIVWLGALQYLQSGQTYVAFFSESVQGLQRDSVVKYRGVDVGRVEQIRVAPDYKLIEVVMQIDLHGEPQNELVAQLKSVGITGIVFVELDLKKKGGPDYSPEITFAAEYPIIPTQPSEITQIISMITNVAQEIRGIDFKGMGEKLKGVFDAANQIITDKRLDKILGEVYKASVNLANLTARGEKVLRELHLPEVRDQAVEVLLEAKRAMSDARTMISETRTDVAQADLAGTTGEYRGFIKRLGGQTDEVAEELKAAAENIRRATENLDDLLRRLQQSPSSIIFSKPPPPREDVDHE